MALPVKKIRNKKKLPSKVIKAYKNINWYLQRGGKVCKSGKAASYDTLNQRRRFLENSIRILHREGYIIIDMVNFKEKHMHILFNEWLKRGNAADTIQNKLSYMRVFEIWINKPNLTNRSIETFSRKEEFLASIISLPMKDRPDKSFTGNGVSPVEAIHLLAAEEPRIALTATLEYMFGLRVEEAMRFKPVDDGEDIKIKVGKGAKGGRCRDGVESLLPPKSTSAFLEFLKAYVGQRRGISMVPEDKTFVQWRRHYYYVLRKVGLTQDQLGVTSHGLRHEYAQGQYEAMCNEIAPIAMKSVNGLTNKQKRHNAKLKISQDLGHNRKNIASLYGL